MWMWSKVRAAFLSVLVALFVLPGPEAGWAGGLYQPVFRLTAIPVPITYAFGGGLNEQAQVSGTYDAFFTKGFLWTGGSTVQDIGALSSGGTTSANGINNRTQITGYSYLLRVTPPHAFLWDRGTMLDLGTLAGPSNAGAGGPQSSGAVLNDLGQVTGSSDTAAGGRHAFLWQNGQMRDLGTLGGANSSGAAINVLGQVTGAGDTADGATHAFVWQNGQMRDLGTLGGANSSGAAINDLGQVTGSSALGNDAGTHAVVWDRDRVRDLGTLGGRNSTGAAINDRGEVAGSSDTAGGERHAFLWSPSLGMLDLNALIDSSDPFMQSVSSLTLTDAVAINNSGQILVNGNGRDTSGRLFYLPFLLTDPPSDIPEPAPLLLLLTAALTALPMLRRK